MAAVTGTSLKVGILSLGEMGAGIAKLLIAKGFPVATNIQGRSEDTIERARNAQVELLTSDLDLVRQCPAILSVVPPRDAEATAQRVIDALSGGEPCGEPLYFADLNAVSPSTTKRIAALFDRARAPVRFVDGCILGGPPKRKTPAPGAASDGAARSTNVSLPDGSDPEWSRPRIPVSGPHALPGDGRLAGALNARSISGEVGAASGLKMCFAAMSKGFTALATQAFTTAQAQGVAGELRGEMAALLPAHLALAEGGVPAMPPKAYRWVREMEEIADTMHDAGGWGPEMFAGAAGVYKAVAEDAVLGREKTGKRTRGTSVEDVAAAMAEGLERKKKKTV